MANLTTTNIDTADLRIDDGEYESGLFTAGGAVTYLKGTLLARDSVSLKWVPFVVGGSTNGNGIPSAVLPYEVVAGGAGDIKVRVLKTGTVDRDRLVVHADGDASNLTAAHDDTLRTFGIITQTVTQLAGLDNQ